MSLCAMSPESIDRLSFYAQVENVIIGFSNSSLPHCVRLLSEDNLVLGNAISRTSLRPAIPSLVQQGLTPSAQKGASANEHRN
jgi:DNA-binding FadR family transcriptional regulator